MWRNQKSTVGERCRDDSLQKDEKINIPGYLTELQQSLSLPLKALGHYVLIVLFGYVLVKVAVGAPLKTVRPLHRGEGKIRRKVTLTITWANFPDVT